MGTHLDLIYCICTCTGNEYFVKKNGTRVRTCLCNEYINTYHEFILPNRLERTARSQYSVSISTATTVGSEKSAGSTSGRDAENSWRDGRLFWKGKCPVS